MVQQHSCLLGWLLCISLHIKAHNQRGNQHNDFLDPNKTSQQLLMYKLYGPDDYIFLVESI